MRLGDFVDSSTLHNWDIMDYVHESFLIELCGFTFGI
jgi:hypothetical protein